MTYLLNMTADEFFLHAFLQIMIIFAVVAVITIIGDAIARRIDEKKERERRAYKRYDAAIRPTRRY